MIILFHLLSYSITKFIQKILTTSTRDTNENLVSCCCASDLHSDLENDIKFDPPAFRQRYGEVFNTLLDDKWREGIKKIIDFGCSEFGLFIFIKRLISLNEIYFVDIEEDLLREHIWKLQPLTVEYLKRRNDPLNISIFCGSVADPDYRLRDTDAVTAIELIEHLYPDSLEAFPYNIFGYIHPKIAIVTTPNVDFNVVFKKITRFRHYDHKFEWSREQFQDWALNIVSRFPDYEVSFSGIAKGPEGTEKYGCCSQMASFVRKDISESQVSNAYKPCKCSTISFCLSKNENSKMICNCVCRECCPNSSYGICTYLSHSAAPNNDINPSCNDFYKLIDKIEYPFEADERSQEEKLIDEFNYRIINFGQQRGRFFNTETNRSEIPLNQIIYGPDGAFLSISELNNLLQKIGYNTEECIIQETGQSELCVLYDPGMEDYTSTSDASGYESSDFTKYEHKTDDSMSDWDEPIHDKKKIIETDSGTEKDSVPVEKSKEIIYDSAYEVEEKISDSLPLKRTSGMTSPELPDCMIQSVIFDPNSPKPFTSLGQVFHTLSVDSVIFQDVNSGMSSSSDPNKRDFVTNAVVSIAPEFNISKLDVNRINELDSFGNQNQYYQFPSSRTFTNHVLRHQNDTKKSQFKDKEKDPLPGPSNAKKRKKFKITWSSESEDDNSLEDVKSIANCLLENTLNKLDINEDNMNKPDGIIELNEQEPTTEVQVFSDVEEPLVENLDSANNNREIDEISYSDEANEVIQNILNRVLENNEVNVNQNNIENNESVPIAPLENAESTEGNLELNAESSVSHASREALFDPNSQVDLLEDFEIPTLVNEAENSETEDAPIDVSNIVIIGVRHIPNDSNSVLSVTPNGFPNWLLQLLGANVGPEQLEEVNESHDEPHFYCQGDGLGVHPSVIAVDIDEEEDADSESSSNDTADFAEVEPGTSEPEVLSIQEDSLPGNSSTFTPPETITENEPEDVRQNSETDEYFDTHNSDLNINSTSK